MIKNISTKIAFFAAFLCSFGSKANYTPADPTFKSYFWSSSEVLAIAPQADGKILAAGIFKYYNGIVMNNVVRMKSDGTADTTFKVGTGANADIYCVAVQKDGKVIIGGMFTTFNDIACNKVARLNVDGSVDQTFNPAITNNGGSIRKIIVRSDDKIYLAGSFSYLIGAVSHAGMVLLNVDGSINTGFAPGNLGAIFNTVVQPDSKILISGVMDNNTVKRLNTNGTVDATFVLTEKVAAFPCQFGVQADGKIVIAGNFRSFNNVAKNGIVRISATGTIDASFDPLAGFPVSNIYDMALQADGKIVAVGNFGKYNNIYSNSVVRINTNGTYDNTFISQYLTSAKAVSILPDGKILIGGDFSDYYKQENTRALVRLLNCLAPSKPVITKAAPSTPICENIPFEIIVQTTGTVKWYTTSTGGSSVAEGTTFKPSTLAGYYTYYGEASNTCAINPDRVSVTFQLLSNPTVTILASKQSVCKGDSLSLTQQTRSTFSPPATSFVWDNDVVSGQFFSPKATKTYTLIGTNDAGCSTTTSVTIPVLAKPDIAINASTTRVCAGSVAALTANGADTYTWTNGVTNGAQFTPTKTASYTVIGTTNTCNDTASIEVLVVPMPDVTLTITGKTIEVKQTGAVYIWAYCVGGKTVPNEKSQSFSPPDNALYNVFVSYNGCVKGSECANITLTEIENVSIEESLLVTISPNPTNGIFTLKSKKGGDFSILNELGQSIKELQLPANNELPIDLGRLNSGIYFLVDHATSKHQKIVVNQ